MCYKTLLSPSLFFTEKTLKRMQLCTQMCVSWRFPLRPSLPIRSWCICKIWRKLWFLCTKLKVLPSLADSFTALLACGQWYCGRHWPFRHQSPVSCVCFPFHRRRTKSSFVSLPRKLWATSTKFLLLSNAYSKKQDWKTWWDMSAFSLTALPWSLLFGR